MYIKTAGTYIAVNDKFAVLIRVTGMYPHLKIASGIYLNDFLQYGKVTPLKETSLEIQSILESPGNFTYSTMDILEDMALPGLDYISMGKVEFDDEVFTKYKQRLLDLRNIPGLSINGLLLSIMQEFSYSLPQARSMLAEIRKRIRNEGA